MARRRKDDDLFGVAAQIAGLLVLLSLFSPDIRQLIFAFGFLAICAVIIAVLGLTGFVIYRLIRAKRIGLSESNFNEGILQAPTIHPAARHAIPDLIEQLRSIDWFQFEKFIELLYKNKGYSVHRRGGANPDGGIDLIIEKSGERTAVQCKHWKTWKVRINTVRELFGVMTHEKITKGIVITLCGYTDEAGGFANQHQIEIVNETDLLKAIEATGARFDPQVLALLSDTRKFCPKCEREMLLKTAGKGRHVGKEFWGCSGYPLKCRYTMPV